MLLFIIWDKYMLVYFKPLISGHSTKEDTQTSAFST